MNLILISFFAVNFHDFKSTFKNLMTKGVPSKSVILMNYTSVAFFQVTFSEFEVNFRFSSQFLGLSSQLL